MKFDSSRNILLAAMPLVAVYNITPDGRIYGKPVASRRAAPIRSSLECHATSRRIVGGTFG